MPVLVHVRSERPDEWLWEVLKRVRGKYKVRIHYDEEWEPWIGVRGVSKDEATREARQLFSEVREILAKNPEVEGILASERDGFYKICVKFKRGGIACFHVYPDTLPLEEKYKPLRD